MSLPESEHPSPSNYPESIDNSNWVDASESKNVLSVPDFPNPNYQEKLTKQASGDVLVMVETAFLASTASLIWLINYYFPLGPLLRIFFPVPIALLYLRWNHRAAWMATLVSGLLLSVLMGPTRSIIFVIPFGLLGVQLGFFWKRNASWGVSLFFGTIIGSFGLFFRIWLVSVLIGEDLWSYVLNQITSLADWIFLRLGLLAKPDLWLIELLAFLLIIFNNIVYVFVVHLVSLLVLDRIGNPIPRPPEWVKILLDYE